VHELLHLNDLLAVRADGSIEVKLAAGELFEFGLQACDLILELTDHSILGVLVNPWLILDILGAGGITQG
jgi:hypothetical protein